MMDVQKKMTVDMLHGSMAGPMVIFALPLALTGVLQQLFNTADTLVLGQFVGTDALAAVGNNAPIISLLVNLFIGISLGANVVIARFIGAHDLKETIRAVHTSFLLALLLGIFVAVLGELIARPMLELLAVPDSVMPAAELYLRIYFLGLPVMALYNFSAAALRALGNTRQPLIYLAIAGVLNVIMNLFFVIVVGIDVAGVAIATVLSQCVSGFLTVRCLLTSQELHVKELHFSGHIFKKMMNIGIPAGIQGSLFSISNFIIQASVNSFGAAVIAGNSACVSVEGLLYCPSDAVMQAATTAVSQNVGAQEYERSRSVARWSMVLVVVLTGILTVPAVVFRRQVLGLYTSSGAELQAAFTRMMIVCLTYSLDGTMAAMSGVNRGLGYSMLSAAVTFVGACVFRIIWVYTVFASVGTLESLYVSYPISWILSTAAHIVCYYIIRKKPFKATLAAKSAAA